ncbi:hypothetical protein EVAR_31506_1 [Eumeta japonica]|uniref:Uncharacterized protein n=1 Tax=Eumeta variegata TaxID=151549 RepID=A0A4C1Z2B6_EUMVA|nr:hypothetical protein EVAR_31506_1 [Eumeta japonica]
MWSSFAAQNVHAAIDSGTHRRRVARGCAAATGCGPLEIVFTQNDPFTYGKTKRLRSVKPHSDCAIQQAWLAHACWIAQFVRIWRRSSNARIDVTHQKSIPCSSTTAWYSIPLTGYTHVRTTGGKSASARPRAEIDKNRRAGGAARPAGVIRARQTSRLTQNNRAASLCGAVAL